MWLRAMLRCGRRLSTGDPPAGALKAALGGGKTREYFDRGPEAAPVRAAAEGNLSLVMLQGSLVQVLRREVRRQGN